jgi:hypothetical protein
MEDQEVQLDRDRVLAVPAPTAWPMIMALGLSLSLAGIVTAVSVSVVGIVLFVAGAVGWFRELFPVEHRVEIPIVAAEAIPAPVPVKVAQLEVGEQGNRASLPLEVYPYSAGIKGGIAGGFVMAVLATLQGIVAHRSPWYTINILAATVNASMAHADTAYLSAFHLDAFMQALVIHAVLSLLMGLLYGLMLPMFPSHPAFFGGLVAPLLWTGLMWASLGILNPVLNQRIEWGGFVACQIAFGLTAGLLTARSERISTLQHLPFALRSQIQASGMRTREDQK